MKDGDTYRGWKITVHDLTRDWPCSTRCFWYAHAIGRRGEMDSVFCTRRDNAIRALKRLIDDQEAGRRARLTLRAWSRNLCQDYHIGDMAVLTDCCVGDIRQ